MSSRRRGSKVATWASLSRLQEGKNSSEVWLSARFEIRVKERLERITYPMVSANLRHQSARSLTNCLLLRPI